MVLIARKGSKTKGSPKILNTRSFKKFNDEAFLRDLKSLDWSEVLLSNDVDKATSAFNLNILSSINRYTPSVRKKVQHSCPPWVNNHLLTSIKEVKYLKKVVTTRVPKPCRPGQISNVKETRPTISKLNLRKTISKTY
jgi:hypothetical protein